MGAATIDRQARFIAYGSFAIALLTGAITTVNFFNTRKNTAELQERQRAERLVEAYDKLGGQERAVLSVAFEVAKSTAEQGRVIEAGRIIESVLRSDPGNRRALELHGIYYGRLGRGDRAVQELRELVRIHPTYATGWNALGDALLTTAHLEEATNSFRESIKADDKYPLPHNGLGVTLARQGLFATAITEYEKALALDPGRPLVYCNLGAALFQQHRNQEALEATRKAIELDPSKALYHRNIGVILQAMGRSADAGKEFETADRVDAHFGQVH